MKFLKLTMIAVIVSFIGHSAYEAWAVDATAHIRAYADQGRSAGYVTNIGMAAVLDADGNYGISTDIRYQLARRAITVPVGMTSAAGDTFDAPIMVVPPGVTYAIESIQLSAAVEATGSGVARGQMVYHKWQGDTILVLDTLVAKFEMDADSAIVYGDTVYTMSYTDSSFIAGELIFWRQFNSGASTIEGSAVTILYRLDE